MERKEYYTLKDIIKLDAIFEIKKAFKRYGIEGTEQKLKELYRLMPTYRNYMLKTYKEILNEKKNNCK